MQNTISLSLLLPLLMAVLSHPPSVVASASTEPTVLIVMLIRNKEPYLPYTLTQLSRLDYPKDKLLLWLRSDHNEDDTPWLVTEWLQRWRHRYREVDALVNITSPRRRQDETGAAHMSDSRYADVIQMKEQTLLKARMLAVDYAWFLDADVLLYDKKILRMLIELGKPLVAPMLDTTERYSNFWAGMNDEFYYRRTEQYGQIYDREEKGCFEVPMIHSCVLVDLQEKLSKTLTFVKAKLSKPVGPELDDVITFAISAQQSGLPMHVCNEEKYGQLPIPLHESDDLDLEWENLFKMKLEALKTVSKFHVDKVLRQFLPPPLEKSAIGFDHIYVISLKRRPQRRQRVISLFNEIGIDGTIVDAIDGHKLNASYLLDHNISMLPCYSDPKIKRALTYGEVGCFLSHYVIWKDIVLNNYRRAIIFEDDVHLDLDFELKLTEAVKELDDLHPNWDLLYLYRETYFLKRRGIQDTSEPVDGSERLVRPGYSYSSLAYALSQAGARKLVQEKPLQKMMPVDELLSIMFGAHPNKNWSAQFAGSGTMKAFAIEPNIAQPYLYKEDGAITDTDQSDIVSIWDDDEIQSCPGDPALKQACQMSQCVLSV